MSRIDFVFWWQKSSCRLLSAPVGSCRLLSAHAVMTTYKNIRNLKSKRNLFALNGTVQWVQIQKVSYNFQRFASTAYQKLIITFGQILFLDIFKKAKSNFKLAFESSTLRQFIAPLQICFLKKIDVAACSAYFWWFISFLFIFKSFMLLDAFPLTFEIKGTFPFLKFICSWLSFT